jgi:Immunoglobulin domain
VRHSQEFVLQNVQEGTSTTLECQLDNVNENNFVKWLKDGKEIFDASVNISDSSKFDVDARSLLLTINDISEENAGIYDCEMFNERNEFIIKSKNRYNVIVQGLCSKNRKSTKIRLLVENCMCIVKI